MNKYQLEVDEIFARLYNEEITEEQAKEEYIKYFEHFQTLDDDEAKIAIASMYLHKYAIDFNPEASFKIYDELAKKDNIDAILGLASAYKRGDYVEKDISKVIELYQHAISLGSTYAHSYLADVYLDGIHMKKDEKNGFIHRKISADSGNSMDAYNVGIMYHNGEGVKKDKVEAIRYITMAATCEKPYYGAIFLLGYEHLFGKNLEINYEKAYNYFQKVLEIAPDEYRTTYHLALMYENGLYVEQDINKAYELLLLSSNCAFEPAIKALKGKKYRGFKK